MDSLHTFTTTAASALDAGWCDEAAVTAIEYALIASLIVVACIGGFTAYSTALKNLYETWVAAAIAVF